MVETQAEGLCVDASVRVPRVCFDAGFCLF